MSLFRRDKPDDERVSLAYPLFYILARVEGAGPESAQRISDALRAKWGRETPTVGNWRQIVDETRRTVELADLAKKTLHHMERIPDNGGTE